MKNYSVQRVNLAAYLGCAFFGVTMLSLGVILPPLQKILPEALALPPLLSVGIITSTILFGPIMDRYGYKWLLICATFFLLVGLIGMAYLMDIRALRISIFLIGFGGGILNGETIAIVSDINDDAHRTTKLSILAGSYCVGCILWTLSCNVFTNYKIPLIASAIVMGTAVIFFICTKFPAAKGARSNMAKTSSDISADANADVYVTENNENGFVAFFKSFALLKYPALVIVAIMLFFQTALEAVSVIFTTSYITMFPGGLSLKLALFSLTLMTVGMMAGRFAVPLIIKKLRDIVALDVYLLLAFIGCILLILWPMSVPAVYIAMTLIGFGIAATPPIILGYLGGVFRKKSGAAFSIAIFIALCGQLAANLLIGKVFLANPTHHNAFILFPIVPCVLIVIVILMAPFAVARCKKTRTYNDNNGIQL
jgi:FHS family glucose/mannose:H+ symporter-like MFS transporter